MTVGELLTRISSRELSEWQCYFKLEGMLGEERADWRAGMVASTIANANRDPKKQPTAYTAQDFMPRFGNADEQKPERTEQTVEQQAGIARNLARMLGGQIEVGE